jgi:hypothetical protein
MDVFFNVLRSMLRRKISSTTFNSADWQTLEPLTTNYIKVIDQMRKMMDDYMCGTTRSVTNPTTGAKERVYKINGRADFIEHGADLLISEGLASEADFKDHRIESLLSSARLNLIFVTYTQQVQEFAAYEMRVTDPDYINLFPAARFVRRPGAENPRPRHVAAEGEVRRYDDFDFWLFQNAADIGGFEVPWGPWGFNSYMTTEPVSRAEAEALKVIRKGQQFMPLDLTPWGVAPKTQFDKSLTATVDDITPEIRQQAIDTITSRIGPSAIGTDGTMTLDAMIKIRNLK